MCSFADYLRHLVSAWRSHCVFCESELPLAQLAGPEVDPPVVFVGETIRAAWACGRL